MAKEFKPTDDMVTAATMVFQGMALVGTVEPTVRGYEREVLEQMEPKSRSWEKHDFPAKVITEPKDAWQMDEEEFLVYLGRVNDKQKGHPEVVAIVNSVRIAWGQEPIDFEAQPDYCPLLVAEDMLRGRRRQLIDVMEPVTGIDAQSVLCSGLDNYDKFVDLTLRLLAPFVEDAHKGLTVGGNSDERRTPGKAGGSVQVVA
jgi:hypothetical protein